VSIDPGQDDLIILAVVMCIDEMAHEARQETQFLILGMSYFQRLSYPSVTKTNQSV